MFLPGALFFDRTPPCDDDSDEFLRFARRFIKLVNGRRRVALSGLGVSKGLKSQGRQAAKLTMRTRDGVNGGHVFSSVLPTLTLFEGIPGLCSKEMANVESDRGEEVGSVLSMGYKPRSACG